MTDQIKPPHAVSVWTSANVLHAEFPGPNGTAHTLQLPLNVWGLTQLVNILSARHIESKIGSKGELTQWQAEEEMKQLAKGIDPSLIKRPKTKVAFTPKLQNSIREIMRKVGISS